MPTRFQINKRKTIGYNLVIFPPKFGGQKVKVFMKKKLALAYAKRKGFKK